MDTEKWMPVEGYGDKYEVSNLGRIKSHHKRRPKILLIHKKIMCEEKIFYNIKEASNYYGINYSTLCCWLNGTNPMPKEWKKKGLSYYGK